MIEKLKLLRTSERFDDIFAVKLIEFHFQN